MKPDVQIKKISEAPNLQLLKDTFGVSETDLIVAYGDAIYCPEMGMSKDLLVHEMVHCERQGFNVRTADRWWERYMREESFRLDEEVLAYRAQYRFCCRVYTDRNKQAKILWVMANDLSSERYGKICTHSEAMQLIKNA